jgi:hypothetical protein
MNTFNFTQAQSTLSAQSNEFAKVFTAHATKIAAAQQSWLQNQADTAKAQFEQLTTTKDLAVATQTIQNNIQPAAEAMIKHAQQLFNLTLEAQKELTAKVQDSYHAFAVEANTAIDASIKQMPNEGEPFVGMAKNASQSIVSVLEQVASHVKTAQTNYEAQIAKLFDNALTAVATPIVPVTTKPAAKKAA